MGKEPLGDMDQTDWDAIAKDLHDANQRKDPQGMSQSEPPASASRSSRSHSDNPPSKKPERFWGSQNTSDQIGQGEPPRNLPPTDQRPNPEPNPGRTSRRGFLGRAFGAFATVGGVAIGSFLGNRHAQLHPAAPESDPIAESLKAKLFYGAVGEALYEHLGRVGVGPGEQIYLFSINAKTIKGFTENDFAVVSPKDGSSGWPRIFLQHKAYVVELKPFLKHFSNATEVSWYIPGYSETNPKQPDESKNQYILTYTDHHEEYGSGQPRAVEGPSYVLYRPPNQQLKELVGENYFLNRTALITDNELDNHTRLALREKRVIPPARLSKP